MGLSVGIVGLPNAGKSTLFNALLSRQMAKVESFPFTTIEPNVGIVPVPDERLEKLAKLINPQITTPAAVEFIDIAGLIKDAHKGEGLGNQFLGKIREVAAVVHLVRVFSNPNVSHYYETIDPPRDIEIVNIELQLGDIQKPAIYVLNIDEKDIGVSSKKWVEKWELDRVGITEVISICAKVEMELAELSPEERKEYLKEIGVEESGLDKLIKKAYQLLNLITFYTIKGGKEVRAWSLSRGENVLAAAAEVHTDMAKGFIKAEVVEFEDLVKYGGWKKAAEAGKVRLEGKDYVVKDNDIIEFRFAV